VRELLVATACAPAALGIVGVLPATVDAGDQAAAEAAVAVFNERLAAAGWTSTGPFSEAAPEGDEETAFGTCLSGFERYLDYTDVHFDGETARAFSDDFERVRSEPAGASSIGDYGYAGAVVLTAADSAVGVLDTFVSQLGAEETQACVKDQAAFESMSDEDTHMQVTVTNDSELGVGDASARLDLDVRVNYQGTELSTSATFAAARVDRTLVVVAAGGSGSAASDLDPVAELAAMVETFG
jgi:hypothetical protein